MHTRPLGLAMGHGLMEAVVFVRGCGDPGRPLDLEAGHCYSVAFFSVDVEVRNHPIVGVVRSLPVPNRSLCSE